MQFAKQDDYEKREPPYVRFEDRPVEDREASMATGRLVEKTAYYAHISARGSKNIVEREVGEWLEDLKTKSERHLYPRDWYEGFKKRFEDFRSGQESIVEGTHVKSWPLIDRATANNLCSLGILTVEQVAEMSEEAMRNVGHGGRSLKQRATDWLKSANKHKASAEIEQQRARADNAEARIATLEKQIAELLTKTQETI